MNQISHHVYGIGQSKVSNDNSIIYCSVFRNTFKINNHEFPAFKQLAIVASKVQSFDRLRSSHAFILQS